MSRIVKPLTNTTIKNLKPRSKEYVKSDGNGLYLRIKPSGAKIWNFSYKFTNKLKRMSLGQFPYLSLELAREKAQEYRTLLFKNIDPMSYRAEQARPVENKVVTFYDIATAWKDKRINLGKLKRETIFDSFRRIEIHIMPFIADWNIQEINLNKILPILLPLKNSNTLYKINIALNQIFQYAEDEDIIVKNPFRKIHDDFYYEETKNHPTIKPTELSTLFKALINSNINQPTILLIEWQLLTMLRPAEAVSIEWNDINFDEKSLHIPAERMKGGKRSHDIPLSAQALKLLEKMKAYNGNRKYVFSSYTAPYNKPMSKQSANVALKRIGFKGLLVSHGLRSIASTYLHELDVFSAEAIELCLAHSNKGKVRAAYDKSKKWKSRQTIMQTWGDFVEECKIKAIKS